MGDIISYGQAISGYKDNQKQYPFAYHDISEESKKDPQWYKKVCESLYANFLRDNTALPYSRRQDFTMQRLYAKGMQPVEKYMDILSPTDPKSGKRKGYSNLSWDIISVAPKFLSIIEGMFDRIEHNVSVDVIDESGLEEKESKKWEIWAKIQLSKLLKEQIENENGLPYQPQTLSELEIMSDNGMLKLDAEANIEKWLNAAFYHSDWNEIKKNLIHDAVSLDVLGCRDYIDQRDNKTKTKYIDPNNLIVRYSRSRTFDNVDIIGYVDFYTIAQLRPLLYKEGKTEEDIRNIAQGYLGVEGNPDRMTTDYSKYYDLNGYYEYDSYKVAVLDAEWDSNKTDTYRKEITGKGRIKFDKKPNGYKEEDNTIKIPQDTKIEINNSVFHTICKAKWIIGTNTVFEWGEKENLPRSTSQNGKHKDIAHKSFHIYKLGDKSLIAQIIPQLDIIQLCSLRIQNALMKAPHAGIAIEFGTLSNMTLGGNKMNELDILRIFHTDGTLLYRANPIHSTMYSPNAGKPIQQLEGGAGRFVLEQAQEIERNLIMIRDILGINPIVDASANSQQATQVGLGVSKMLSAATNNALQPIYSAYVYLKEKAAANMARTAQLLANYNKQQSTFPKAGKTESVTLNKDVFKYDMGIRMVMKPTDEQKQMVLQAAIKAQSVPLEQGGISAGDLFMIQNAIEEGNLKYAQIYLALKEKQNKEFAAQMQKDNIDHQQAGAQQTAQVQGEIYKQNKIADAQAEIMVEQAKSDNRKKEAMIAHQNKMVELQFTKGVDTQIAAHKQEKETERAIIKKQEATV